MFLLFLPEFAKEAPIDLQPFFGQVAFPPANQFAESLCLHQWTDDWVGLGSSTNLEQAHGPSRDEKRPLERADPMTSKGCTIIGTFVKGGDFGWSRLAF